jgi:hypothetical protein
VTRRAVLALVAAVTVLSVAAAGWLTWGRTPADTSTPTHPGLSDQEYAAALKAAHQVQATVTGTFVSATAWAGNGRVRDSNTGHTCTSGRVVHVRLIWMAGASFTHGGTAGEGPSPDGPRQALIVTADAATGQPCLIGASYSHVQPGPDETFLYGPRASRR